MSVNATSVMISRNTLGTALHYGEKEAQAMSARNVSIFGSSQKVDAPFLASPQALAPGMRLWRSLA